MIASEFVVVPVKKRKEKSARFNQRWRDLRGWINGLPTGEADRQLYLQEKWAIAAIDRVLSLSFVQSLWRPWFENLYLCDQHRWFVTVIAKGQISGSFCWCELRWPWTGEVQEDRLLPLELNEGKSIEEMVRGRQSHTQTSIANDLPKPTWFDTTIGASFALAGFPLILIQLYPSDNIMPRAKNFIGCCNMNLHAGKGLFRSAPITLMVPIVHAPKRLVNKSHSRKGSRIGPSTAYFILSLPVTCQVLFMKGLRLSFVQSFKKDWDNDDGKRGV